MSHSVTAKTLIATAALALVLAACTARDDSRPADTAAPDAPPAAPAVPAQDVAPATGAMLDPNTATREQLLAITGMDAVAADSLLARRPFASMVAVDRALAPHLTAAARDSVYARLWKPIDLNAASDEEILLIPGIGERMKREFKEYRPYRSIAQFRREMGKYVDDAEVARLERYVSVK